MYNKSFSEQNANPETFIKQGIKKTKESINVMDLGIVIGNGEDLYSEKGFESKQIKLLRKRKRYNNANELEETSMPILSDVPTRGKAEVGDIVIVLYANSDIRGALGLTTIEPKDFDHDINNAVAIGIITAGEE